MANKPRVICFNLSILVSFVLIALWGTVFLIASSASAQEACICEKTKNSICSSQGFQITLIDFEIDQLSGTSTWDYEVCNDKNLDWSCVPSKNLSHIDINMPDLGTCLNPPKEITISQHSGFDNAHLDCDIVQVDPACDISGTPGEDFIAHCDVGGSNLDPGECVGMRLSISGGQSPIGIGSAMTVTKAGTACASDCIFGPSCTPCEPIIIEECLTRTLQFWANHPNITIQFLPITVCGEELNIITAGSCESSSEALCVSPCMEPRFILPYANLVQQLTAAKLNLKATAVYAGYCGEDIITRIAECESLCDALPLEIIQSKCILDLAAFNESEDTISIMPQPFNQPGPVDPQECVAARDNLMIIGKGICQ